MESEKLNYYKKKLLNEKKDVNELIALMIKNETIDSNNEIAQELSFYDNHPSDIATEISDIERGMAFKNNEKDILKKIDNALDSIEQGEYGICKNCGAVINEERLEFIPYAEYCTKCQNSYNSLKPRQINDRPVEEKVMGYPFSGKNKEDFYNPEFDAQDSIESVERFNKLHNITEFYDHEDEQGFVEDIERISNEQYKNQLPD